MAGEHTFVWTTIGTLIVCAILLFVAGFILGYCYGSRKQSH